MSIFNKIFGGDDADERREPQSRERQTNLSNAAPQSADEQAIARYRYLLRTAPPETIEQAHAEAFARLTPQQRQTVLQQLAAELPAAERRVAENADDPQTLARLATRAEIRQPGTIERVFGNWNNGYGGFGGGGIGFGGLLAGSFLSSLAGSVIGGYIAEQFFDNDPNYLANNFDGAPDNFAADDYQNNDFANAPEEVYTSDNVDATEFDSGLDDFGDAGGDFGGGDFGGSDF